MRRVRLTQWVSLYMAAGVGERRVMIIKELLKYIDNNQKIIILYSWHNELFKGLAREVNPFDKKISSAEVDFIYLDNDLYTKDFIKIKIKKD